MVLIKDGKKYKTLKELAAEYNIPLKLIQGRYVRGLRSVQELIQPKHYNNK
jgi:hypothetical protein